MQSGLSFTHKKITQQKPSGFVHSHTKKETIFTLSLQKTVQPELYAILNQSSFCLYVGCKRLFDK